MCLSAAQIQRKDLKVQHNILQYVKGYFLKYKILRNTKRVKNIPLNSINDKWTELKGKIMNKHRVIMGDFNSRLKISDRRSRPVMQKIEPLKIVSYHRMITKTMTEYTFFQVPREHLLKIDHKAIMQTFNKDDF